MKLLRTYIGGSKKNEIDIFSEFYSSNEINWVKYLNLFNIFSNDFVLVLSSRLKLLKITTHILFLVTIFFMLININYLFLIIPSFLFWFFEYKLNLKKRKIEVLNKFTISIIKREMNKMYNL